MIKAWDRQTIPKDNETYGFIQWKGTDVCMDFYCKCGEQLHIDAYFVYNIECPACKTTYMCSPFVEMIELTEEEIADTDCIYTKKNL